MNRIFRLSLVILIFSFLMPRPVSYSTADTARISLSLKKEVEHSIIRALKWLSTKQETDGSWQHYPAITALVLSSFLRSHPNISPQDSILAIGFDYLKRCIHPNGGIYIDDMQTYNTAICLMAFEDARSLEFTEVIRNAKKFLLNMQNDETRGYTADSLYYGGLSYGAGDKPADLSNMQWALEAMQIRYIEKDGIIQPFVDKKLQQRQQLFWDKAILFLQRCQNLKKTNDQPYSGNDGGFMYGPGTSKAGGTRSYGSMTYAGLKSFIHARLSKNDPRVQAAFRWICKHYDLKKNPGMGAQGLFYYYHTMAKALNALGEEIIVDQHGKKHKWREELADQLLQIQRPEGYWINENGRWWENNPVLVTAYVVLALEEVSAEK